MENNARKEFDPDLEDFSSRVNKFIQLEHAWKKVNAKKCSVLCTLEVLILHVSWKQLLYDFLNIKKI